MMDRQVLLHLSLIPQLGPAVIEKLLAVLRQRHIPYHELYSFSLADFAAIQGISPIQAERLFKGLAHKSILEKELELIEKHSITLYTLADEEYPSLLRNIYLPPPLLYCKGKPLKHHEKRLAVVGSRQATAYAQKVVDALVPPVVKYEWEIVSGGARGVDTFAHRAALQNNGSTIVVFGSGLLRYYPESNTALFDEIADGRGTLVSCFPLLMNPDRGLFPARNRIIAGLSQGTMVVQAAHKSGALITARYALEEGRQVFAVPGSIFDEVSLGCHSLLKQGAVPVSSAYDILHEFGEALDSSPGEHVAQAVVAEQTSFIPGTTPEGSTAQFLSHLTLPATCDELSLKAGMPLTELQMLLFSLQLEGKVRQNFAGLWEKC